MASSPDDELEVENRAALSHWQVADLIYDQEWRVGQGLGPTRETTSGLGILQRVEEVGQGPEVDPTPAPSFGFRMEAIPRCPAEPT